MNAKIILEQRGLRATAIRLTIYELFASNRSALSERDIEEHLRDACNRVTIYRTLKSFLDSNIIHKVLDDNSLIKYALCERACDGKAHEHVHFKCQTCGQTVCLETLPLQEIKLPEGFVKQEANMLILGCCASCNDDQK